MRSMRQGVGTRESGEPLIDPISFQVPGGKGCESLRVRGEGESDGLGRSCPDTEEGQGDGSMPKGSPFTGLWLPEGPTAILLSLFLLLP